MSKLKDYCVKITDGEHGSIKDDPSGEFYFLNNNNITEDGILINPTDRKMSKTDFERIHKRTQLSKGDVVIATCGTIGKTHIISDDEINYDFSRSVGIIKCNTTKLLPEFLCFYLKSPIMQRRISYLCEGAVQKHFYIGAMSDLEVDIPDIPTQQKIVNVLSVIEKRIQINKSICSDLEALAKEIYDYWFIQFDFPDDNGKPYKTSGGKMVWNEKLNRNIPAGWTNTPLGQLCDFANGINYDKDELGDKKYSIVNVRNITSSTLLLDSKEFDEIELKSSSADRYIIQQDDILIARSGTPGAVRLLFDFNGNTIFCGFIIRCKPNNSNNRLYLTYLLKCLEGSNATKTGGSILQNVSQDTLGCVGVPMPNDKNGRIIEQFNNSVIPFLNTIQAKMLENQQLIELRKFLLPLLMNGQIKIGE